MKTVKDIRSEFLGYFDKQGHEVVSSSPLVPQNDPTLMFVNSGMVQFKDVFTGKEHRPYTRATTAQKCVRAGGKHNDLDNVGYTARHHTFFEMLGNFSFGDYFKDDAIAFAWELVTKNFGLPAEKLLVTVHTSDEEAADIWKKVTGFSDNKIIRIPTDDNFWRMGDTGPCGPCTEIFYDHGDDIWGGPPGSAEEDGDRFIEIWNLVFMQFEQLTNGEKVNLPNQCVDTGMGLERIAAILQGVHSNYEIDLMDQIIEHVADLTGVAKDSEMGASHRVIADHLRSSAFLMADGVMPSNEGRGYVLRRIMRRGMRHAHILGAKDPLMHKLIPTLVGLMGEAYPELKRAEAMVSQSLEIEETRFKKTLDRGLALLDEETSKLGSSKVLPGEVAFKLYDTFGFPVDLTADALRAKDMSVDMEGFNANMAAQKAQARASWSGTGDEGNEKLWFDLEEEHGATEFLGYEREESEAQIIALVKEGENVQSVAQGDAVQVVLNQTPFYAESGGQVGDAGRITTESGATLDVTDTKKKVGKVFVHMAQVTHGAIKLGDNVKASVDHARRADIKAHHSATHLLHEALRQVLGDHVAQKGSLQDATRTRFDISHPKAISSDELAQIEAIVIKEIEGNTPVETRIMGIDDAMESGARALFGEKYGDEVRVVSMGSIASGANHPFSVELCGGTHVKNTGDIGAFKIINESAVSAGVRRVEAVTGAHVDAYLADKLAAKKDRLDKLKAEIESLKDELAQLGGIDDTVLGASEDDLIAHKKHLQKQISEQRRAQGAQTSDDEVKEVGGVKFVGKVLDGFPPKDLKPMADDLKQKLGSGVVVLVATNDGKASIVVAVTEDLTSRISAVDLVKVGAEALGGKGGGGRPDMAQAGGPDATTANDAVGSIEKKLAG